MSDHYDVILAPVVTEKTAQQMEADNVYTFVVAGTAPTRSRSARQIERIWDVTVQDVRTMKYAGKIKRSFLGRMARNNRIGRRPSYKKAVVQLAEGDHIELYEAG